MIGCRSPFYGETKKVQPCGNFIYYPSRQVIDPIAVMKTYRDNIAVLVKHLNWLNLQKDFRVLWIPHFIIPKQLVAARHNPRVRNYLYDNAKTLLPLLRNVRLIIGRYPLLANDDLSEIELLAEFASCINQYNSVHLLVKIGGYPQGVTRFAKILKNLSYGAKKVIALCNDEYVGLPDIVNLPIRVIPDIFAWWVKSGRYIKADDPAWAFIKRHWRQKPIIISSICSWTSAIWSLSFFIRANYVERIAPRLPNFELIPIDYLERPNKKILLQRCSLEGISRRAEGMWHIRLLDDALEYLEWADVVFDVFGNNLAIPHILTRLEELQNVAA